MSCKYSDIAVSPESLYFEVEEGWGFIPPYQYINIDKVGSGRGAHWEMEVDGPWIRANPISGQVPSRIRVSCESIGKSVGTYMGVITIINEDRPVVLVTLVVKAKEVPEPVPGPVPDPTPKPDPVPDPTPKPDKPEPDPEPDDPDPGEPCWICRLLRRIFIGY